jgi:hypothetical protein
MLVLLGRNWRRALAGSRSGSYNFEGPTDSRYAVGEADRDESARDVDRRFATALTVKLWLDDQLTY